MWKNTNKAYWYIFFGVLLVWVEFFFPVRAGLQVTPFELIPLHKIEILTGAFDVAWSFDGKYLAASDGGGQIHIWNSETWDLITAISCEPYLREGLAWSPNQSVLAVGCSNFGASVQVSSIDNELTIVKFDTFNQAIAWSPDGSHIAVPQENNTIGILDTSFDPIYTLGEALSLPCQTEIGQTDSGGTAYIDFKWSLSGQYLASVEIGQYSSIKIWDVDKQQIIQQTDFAFDITWSPDTSTFTLVTRDISQVEVSYLQTWNVFPLYLIRSEPIANLDAYAIEGPIGSKYVSYCATDGHLYLYDTITAQNTVLQSARTIPCRFNDIAWSSTSLLAFAENDGVSIWSIALVPLQRSTTIPDHLPS